MKKQIKIIALLIVFILALGVATTSNAVTAPDWFAMKVGQDKYKIEQSDDDNAEINLDNDLGGTSSLSSASTEAAPGWLAVCMGKGRKMRPTEVDDGTKDGPGGEINNKSQEIIVKSFEKHNTSEEGEIESWDGSKITVDEEGFNVKDGNLKTYALERMNMTTREEKNGSWILNWGYGNGNKRFRTLYYSPRTVEDYLNESNLSTIYGWKGRPVPTEADVQKLIFELWLANNNYPDEYINLAQMLVWESNLNVENYISEQWIKDTIREITEGGDAFKNYYNQVKEGFNPKISYDNKDVTNKEINISNGNKIIVDQDTKSYIVGPFSISYPTGSFKNMKFSYITSLEVIPENGKELKILEIIDKEGNKVNNAEDLNTDDVFYLRVQGNSTNMKVRANFKYIEKGTADLFVYDGKVYSYYYKSEQITQEKRDDGTTIDYTHYHPIYQKILTCEGHSHTDDCWGYVDVCPICGGYCSDPANHSDQWVPSNEPILICGKEECKEHDDSCYTMAEVDQDKCCKWTYYIYKKLEYDKDDTQPYLLIGKEIGLEYKDANIETGICKLPHTMKVAGTVFLDKDEGKVNEGNNLLDDGEGLEGVDVWLYNSKGTLVKMALTDSKGNYEFDNLDVFEKYYVKFGYNGMLYTNVKRGEGNNASKVEEKSQDRNYLNDKFKEIGSYPNNYDGNKVYYQEDLIELFKEVSKEIVAHNGNEDAAYEAVRRNHSGDSEIVSKLQFVRDCRIYVYSDTYPKIDIFVTDLEPVVGPYGIVNPIYTDVRDNQLHINLGIKARPTFDLALYQDVYKAEVKINGKTQTYVYDDRKAWTGYYENGFPIGVSESDYLSSVREKYIEGSNFSTGKRERDIETDTYTLEMRTEEIKNGTMTEIKDNYASSYKDVSNDDNKKLKIFVTYRISLRNQSGIDGAVTEVVNYFDKNYEFSKAYLGDKDGKQVGNVTKNDTSKYGESTQYKNNDKYNTIYLVPDEVTLNNNNQEAYIYVTLEFKNANQDAGTILSEKILNGDKYNTINLAEINGYKTNEGLIDIDSNPGNLNISRINNFTDEELKVRKYEDDESKAPSFIYSLRESRTLEGTVFEDATGKDNAYYTNQERKGNGTLDNEEKGVEGVKVQLCEVIDSTTLQAVATTTTDENGNYGFIGYLPGEYRIRYVYGSNEDNTIEVSFDKVGYGKYNGQDFESTKQIGTFYDEKQNDKNFYWYKTEVAERLSDAQDTTDRINKVKDYSNGAYDVQITNHKAEVFNSIYSKDAKDLLKELKENTWREAYTQQMSIDMEYESMEVKGNQAPEKYAHKVTNVDFGIVERPHEKLKIEKTVSHVKLTLTDGTVLFDANGETANLQWAKDQISAIADDEQINGAKIEITYNIKVSNLSETNTGNTKIKTIVDYVANNLNFDEAQNPLWEVVKISDIQKDGNSSLVNKGIDLSTRTTTIKAAKENPLLNELKPGDSADTSLVLTKVLSTENVDDLSYENTVEIVEYANDIGRYDRESIPGNLVPDSDPTEEDSAKAGTVAVLPPFGSTMIYYTLAGVVLVMLGVGIFLIKKKVVDKK